ncbi:AsnC family transcriptional regulator [Chloroflexota bacterium]
MEIIINNIDQILLALLQSEFPLTQEPYAELGKKLGVSGDEVQQRIGQLKANGIVRTIGPVINPACLGFRTTLVATMVTEAEMNNAAKLLNDHPMVSHAYERDHHFNLWFTLGFPEKTDIGPEIERLGHKIKAEAAFHLPALKIFKLRTHFGNEKGINDSGIKDTVGTKYDIVQLSVADRRVINELQQDLPQTTYPFADMSVRVDMAVSEFLARCQSLLLRDIMHHFGAAINRHQVGYIANCMTCWKAPPSKIDVAANILTNQSAVSHCYERETNHLWKYNLFAMIHGHNREECIEIADKISAQTELADYVVLFSTKEIKKTRVRYQV